jgi:hypothetical protein
VEVKPDRPTKLQFRPKPGTYALTSYQVILTIRTRAGFRPQEVEPASRDTRNLGAFIRPVYEVK